MIDATIAANLPYTLIERVCSNTTSYLSPSLLTMLTHPPTLSHRLFSYPLSHSQAECVQALRTVGFEVLEARDMALDERFGGSDPPWSSPIY